MTYKEFEKWLDNESLKYCIHNKYLSVSNYSGLVLACISTIERYAFRLIDETPITNEEREKLFNKLVELARTPLEDREEKKKYYVRIPIGLASVETTAIYLTRNIDVPVDFFNPTRYNLSNLQYEFTEDEIKKIDERLWAFAEEVEE